METSKREFKAGDRISVVAKNGDLRTGTLEYAVHGRLQVIWDDDGWLEDLKRVEGESITLLGRTQEVIDLFGMLAEEIYFGLNMKCVMCDAKPETLGALRGFVTKAKSERTKVSKTQRKP